MEEQSKYEKMYHILVNYEMEIHAKNQRRIRLGMRCAIIVPLIFLTMLFWFGGSKAIYMTLWIASLFLICGYLVFIEYMDTKVQELLKEVDHVEKVDALIGGTFDELENMAKERAEEVSQAIEERRNAMDERREEIRGAIDERKGAIGNRIEERLEDHKTVLGDRIEAQKVARRPVKGRRVERMDAIGEKLGTEEPFNQKQGTLLKTAFEDSITYTDWEKESEEPRLDLKEIFHASKEEKSKYEMKIFKNTLPEKEEGAGETVLSETAEQENLNQEGENNA